MSEPPRPGLIVLVCALLLLAFPIIVQQFNASYLLSIASRILIFALAAVSLDLILGFGALMSLGHAAFFGLGGYVVAILARELESDAPMGGLFGATDQALIALPAAMVVSGFAALLIGALSLRTRGVHFIMITLAFAQMIYYIVNSLKVYGGEDGLSIKQRSAVPAANLQNDVVFYYVCFCALALTLYLGHRVLLSRFGVILRAIAANERRVQALGITPFRYQLAAFVLSGAAAGLAGALLANQARYVSPEMLHWTMSAELMLMVVIGGIGTLYGAVLGAVIFMGAQTLLNIWTAHWMIYLGPILVLIVLFARTGVYSALSSVVETKRRGQAPASE